MSRALLVELLGGIGDLIFTLPALDRLRATHPTLDWDVFTFPPGSELLVGDPRVANVIEASRPSTQAKSDSPKESPPRFWTQLAELLSGQRYDLVVSDTRHSGIHRLIESSGVPRAITQLWTGATADEPIPRLFVRR